ncbi:ro-7-like protein [Pochonia chlamydosporia 170]|uniref:Ro-7-like protein n=1 Tax=Pochonia chlamydosporia 170 TaxID=1380566 RepID=A0A179FZN1_METCM|nr:ro-7-like protein [Pochonia chlamydosporia 170]OAQ71062.1 ro-7-like protein [Pochonia chlamydosporia 170]
MSSGAGTTLAHKSVATIRTGTSQAPPSSTPHTPPRTVTSSFGSPSTIRADDDFVLIEIGSRYIRAGFAGDSLPKACLSCGPEQQRRVGDFRVWQEPTSTSSRKWAADHEIWRYDLRQIDLGLFQDKLDRILRDAFTRFLLIDSRPRRVGLVLDSALPLPLLSAVLSTLFTNFQTPMVSLMSTPTMVAVGAGVRSALVVDMGWNETIVTSVYEYREVKSSRTIRGGRSLNDTLYKLLHGLIPTAEDDDESEDRAVTFEECEDIMCRLMWCRPSAFKSSQRQSTQLDTVEEQDENEGEPNQPSGIAEVPLRSTNPPSTIHIPFNKLADVCDDALFDPSAARSTFDDHELPLHLLVYDQLLQLPLDVRAICMSRIIFTGGCSNILGIKERIVDEITSIVERRGWEPVFGKSVENLRNGQRAQRKASLQRSSISSVGTSDSSGYDSDGLRSESGTTDSLEDQVEAKIARNRPMRHQFQGQLRAVHSLGAWAGASLLCQLKIPAMATVDRELWLQQGANGASRPSEVDVKHQQRQSMGAGGLIRGSGGHHSNWTLGIWGSL